MATYFQHRSRSWWIAISAASFVAVLLVAMLAPRVFIARYQSDWDPERSNAARHALVQVQNSQNPLEQLITTKRSVVDVTPAECEWAYPPPTRGNAHVRAYTFFGIPLADWSVTCNSLRRH